MSEGNALLLIKQKLDKNKSFDKTKVENILF